jgi:hypothetical protein
MDGLTTAFVESTTRNVFVNGLDVPSGNKITVPDAPVRVEPITPSDRRELGTSLAFRGGSGVAAAAPEPSPDTEAHEEHLLFGTSAAWSPRTRPWATSPWPTRAWVICWGPAAVGHSLPNTIVFLLLV